MMTLATWRRLKALGAADACRGVDPVTFDCLPSVSERADGPTSEVTAILVHITPEKYSTWRWMSSRMRLCRLVLFNKGGPGPGPRPTKNQIQPDHVQRQAALSAGCHLQSMVHLPRNADRAGTFAPLNTQICEIGLSPYRCSSPVLR